MRVCIIADIRGHARRWVNYLKDRGHKIFVLSPVSGKIEGIEVINMYSLDKDSLIWKIPKLRRVARFLEFRKVISRFKPDIVHIHYIPANIHNLYYYRGIKNLVVYVQGSDIVWEKAKEELPKLKFYVQSLLNQADVIVTPSRFLANIVKQYSTPGKPVYVKPFGVDCSLFSPEKREKSSDTVISFIKHFTSKYGPEYLIRAMKIVVDKFPDTKLFMAGSGELEEDLRKLTSSLGLDKNIIFTGELQHSDVANLLAKTGISVMPSVQSGESLGIAALEAQAMEIPVVASRIGGIPEAVKDGVTGILVEPGNKGQLAEAIIKLIENPDLRERMGEKGREIVLSKYEWGENAKTLESLYRVLVNKNGKI